MSKIKLLIVDDSSTFRKVMRSVMSTQADMEVVGEGEDGLEGLQKALELSPNVVLMDVAMPRMSGIEATGKLKKKCPGITVIGLSVHDDEEYYNSMMEAGASAFLQKETPVDELLSTIRSKTTV